MFCPVITLKHLFVFVNDFFQIFKNTFPLPHPHSRQYLSYHNLFTKTSVIFDISQHIVFIFIQKAQAQQLAIMIYDWHNFLYKQKTGIYVNAPVFYSL